MDVCDHSLMFAQARQTEILKFLREHQRLGFSELQELTGCSPATLRRDLTLLEEQNLLVRVHGGVLHPDAVAEEPSLLMKSQTAMTAKRQIAAMAAEMIPEHATVFIDSGTTCLEAARILRERADLTIITNSLPIIASHARFHARLIALGGEQRAISGALVGSLTTASLVHLRADIALIGASGLDLESGPGTTELLEKEIKSGWLARSRRRILLCDATKWASAATICFAEWDEFTDFITDKRPPVKFCPKTPTIHLS